MLTFYKWFSVVAVLLIANLGLADETARVRINGLQSVDESQARSWIDPQLELVSKQGVSMARADDLAFFLESELIDRGYDDAIVDWQLADGYIELNVEEGGTQMVAGISVSGNKALSSDAIEELFLTTTRNRLQLKAKDASPFVQNDIAKGKAQLLQLYLLLGYTDATIQVEETRTANGTRVSVVITEGDQYVIGDITMPEPLDSEMANAYETMRLSEIGKPLSPVSLSRLKTQVNEVAVNLGYYYTEIDIFQESKSRNASGQKVVDLVVQSNWGKLVIIDGFEVEGNENVNDKFFTKQLTDIVGKPYSPKETNATIEALLRTGAFETIRTELIETDDGSNTLKVYVEERKSRSLGVYGGFATYEGALGGIEFQDRNLFGSARRIDANIEVSRRGLRGEIQYLDPWFLWSDNEFRASLFALNREEEGYERFTTGGRYGLTRRFGQGKRDRISAFGEAIYTEIVDSEIPLIQLGENDYFTHFLGLSLGIDRRDQKINASRGWVLNSSVGIASSAIGSDIDYTKADIGFAAYQPLGIGTLRFRAKAGLIKPINEDEDLPIDLRFFNGGRNSVRSFAERELGGFDFSSGFPLGGEFYSVFNAEYLIPIQSVNGLSIIPFFDAGNLLSDASDFGLQDMRYGYGIGVQYMTLIGPLRIDYGINPDPRQGEEDGALHIGFGSEF